MTDKDEALRNYIKTELAYLKDERTKEHDDWKRVMNLIGRVTFTIEGTERNTKRPSRYTSKPSYFLSTLVSGLTGYSAAESIAWITLTLRDKAALDRYGVKDWLENVRDLIYEELAAGKLYRELPLMVAAAAQFGHGVMLVDEHPDGDRMRAMTVNVAEAYLDMNDSGDVDTVYREFTMPLFRAVNFFGEENVSKEWLRDWEQADKDSASGARRRQVRIVHAVYPRHDSEASGKDASGVDKKRKPWASVYYDPANDHIIEEGGYDSFPYAVFVWERKPGSSYGNSPSILALESIATLNFANKSLMDVAQDSADPWKVMPKRLKGEADNMDEAGKMIYVAPGDQVPQAINTGANYPITVQITQGFEQDIKDLFHVDFFLMLQRQQGLSQMTATAVNQLQGEKAAVMGDLVSNLNDALKTIVIRAYEILIKQNRIPPAPNALAGGKVSVEFVGPLAQIQRRHYELPNLANVLGMAGQFAQLGGVHPKWKAALDYADADRLFKDMLRANSTPERDIAEDDDVEKARQAEAQAAEMQAQAAAAMETQKELLSNADRLNEPVRQGSPLAAMMGQGGAQ